MKYTMKKIWYGKEYKNIKSERMPALDTKKVICSKNVKI